MNSFVAVCDDLPQDYAATGRIAGGLRPRGKLFVHIFAHRTPMYPFESRGEGNWIGRHFFTGGLMPRANTLLWFQRHLQIEQCWHVEGTHSQRSANQWLANQDARRCQVMSALVNDFGSKVARLWLQRWRMFWMSCAELFGYANGHEWRVAHYRFVRP
jgi:cyclopropane-fatty-acyl-phospholipid synthase